MLPRKAFMRLVEVSIASFIIITILLILSAYKPPMNESESAVSMVYGYFGFLESSGDLKLITVTKNTTQLNYLFSKLMSSRYDYAVGWTNFTDSDYSATPPIDKTVRSFSYLVSGYDENFEPTIFEVFIWE